MPRFKTLLLDLDGTLVDAFTTIHRAYVHTLPLFGRPVPTMEAVRRAVGGGLAMAMRHFLPPELIAEASRVHTDYTQKILLEDVKLLPGGLELLRTQHARDMQLAVYTNKLGDNARRICAHLSVAPYLQGIFGAGDTPWLKPQREFSDHVLRELGANPATTLLIGDSPFDVETAHNAAFPCWCVTTGTHDETQLRSAGAEAIYPDLGVLSATIG